MNSASRKPDPAAFLAICKGHGISPERTLFIDDSKQHVNGAAQAGLEAYWHHPVDQDVAVWLAKRGSTSRKPRTVIEA